MTPGVLNYCCPVKNPFVNLFMMPAAFHGVLFVLFH
jgi:hypothetical protein